MKKIDNQDEVEEIEIHHVCITCPICGSRALSFVTEYHKTTIAKFFQILFFVIVIVCALSYSSSTLTNNKNVGLLATALILGIIDIGLTLYIITEESKTHVRAICRDCGNLWLLD